MYLSRETVCQRLSISKWQSYELFKAGAIPYVNAETVIALLNSSRRAREESIDFVPSDIVSAEEAEKRTGIPAEKLKTWVARRTKNIPPHFRINKMTIRFRMSSLSRWLSSRSAG